MLPAFKNLFNYLTGSEIDVDEKRTKPIKAEPIKFFLKYLVKICRLLFPSIISPSTLTFLALLIDVVVLEVVIYRVGLISGKYYKCLSDRDLSAFWSLTINAILYIIVNSVLKSLKDFLASLLSIIWRKCLTQKLHESYFTRMRFYYLQLNHADYDHEPQLVINENVGSENRIILNEANSNKLNKLDNPDQRITQDVNSLCVSFSSIIPLLLITPFVIGWYGYKAFLTVGYSGIGAVLAYFIFWSLINGPLTAPIARIVYKQDKKEGDFRFKHVNIRNNGESIAFYDSAENELNRMTITFENLLNISYRRNWKELILKLFVNISQYMGGILAYLILAIPIFTNVYADYTSAELAQLISNYSFQCQYLIYFFTRLYDTLSEFSVIAGNCKRVGELLKRMDTLGSESLGSPKRSTLIKRNLVEPIELENNSNSSSTDSTDVYLNLRKVSIRVPQSERILIQNLDFEFKKGNNVLITGPSGCGKTSLFRCIKGLWSSYDGEIICSNQNFFFLPQTSYFTDGSLMDQIVYPSVIYESQLTDLNLVEKILNWLNEFNLGHLLQRVDSDLSKVPQFNWINVLSAGEKQRLSFLRVLYHRPDYALLDEFTSSVDQDTEQLMYENLTKHNINYISIAHRDTVKKYHDLELRLKNDSTFGFIQLI